MDSLEIPPSPPKFFFSMYTFQTDLLKQLPNKTFDSNQNKKTSQECFTKFELLFTLHTKKKSSKSEKYNFFGGGGGGLCGGSKTKQNQKNDLLLPWTAWECDLHVVLHNSFLGKRVPAGKRSQVSQHLRWQLFKSGIMVLQEELKCVCVCVKDNAWGWKTWEEQFIKLWTGRAPVHPWRQVQSKGRCELYEIRVEFEFYLCHLPFVILYLYLWY